MSTALLWLVLGAVAVGLPLLVLRVDRHAAAHPPRPCDAWAFRRRHGLAAGESDLLESGVRGGRRMADPRLRLLAVERAEELLRQETRRPSRRVWVLLLLTLVALAAGLALLVVMRPPHDLWAVAGAAVNPALQWTLRSYRLRRLRRARDVNAEPTRP